MTEKMKVKSKTLEELQECQLAHLLGMLLNLPQPQFPCV